MIPMYLWLRWKLGHKEFKPYGRSNPAVRPNVGFGGKGQPPVPQKWWDNLKARWEFRNPFPLAVRPIDAWKGVGYWTSWGFGNGQFVDSAKVRAGTVTAADLRPMLLKLKARGATWVGVHDLVEVRAMAAALSEACQQLGLGLRVWGRYYSPSEFFRADAAVDFWKPFCQGFAVNIEDRGDWSAFASGLRSAHQSMPFACWTTFEGAGVTDAGGYDVNLGKPWWSNGFVCITEAYVCDNSQATPEVMDWTARVKCGFADVVPSIGIYKSGYTVEWHAHLLRNFPDFSVYLAEYLPEVN